MKIRLAFIIMFCTIQTFSQTKKEQIVDIRRKFKIINFTEDYEKVVLENEAYLEQVPDGGGELMGYFKGGELHKATERIGLSYGIRNWEYYFWENELVFVFETEDVFLYHVEKDMWDYNNPERTFEGRYYYVGGEVVELKIKGALRMIGELSEEKQMQEAKDLLIKAKAYTHLLKKKKESHN